MIIKGFPGSSEGKESACNAGDTGDAGLIPGLQGFPGKGNANPLQYSCLENSRGAWWATVHGAAKSQTQLMWLSTHAMIMKANMKCLHMPGTVLSIFHILTHIIPTTTHSQAYNIILILQIRKLRQEEFKPLALDHVAHIEPGFKCRESCAEPKEP